MREICLFLRTRLFSKHSQLQRTVSTPNPFFNTSSPRMSIVSTGNGCVVVRDWRVTSIHVGFPLYPPTVKGWLRFRGLVTPARLSSVRLTLLTSALLGRQGLGSRSLIVFFLGFKCWSTLVNLVLVCGLFPDDWSLWRSWTSRNTS